MKHMTETVTGRTYSFQVDQEAIRGLQQGQGHEPCFRTFQLLSCTTECPWRSLCRKPVAEWRRDW
jgi:hypothetical protein